MQKIIYIFNISINLHKQTPASNFTALSGGMQSGKKGFAAYWANVSATIAWKKHVFKTVYLKLLQCIQCKYIFDVIIITGMQSSAQLNRLLGYH